MRLHSTIPSILHSCDTCAEIDSTTRVVRLLQVDLNRFSNIHIIAKRGNRDVIGAWILYLTAHSARFRSYLLFKRKERHYRF
jgi:hypothetical protein